MKTAVLFDLDDTLIDLQYSRRHGLRAVQEILPDLKRIPLEDLELAHDEELNATYPHILDDSLSAEEAGHIHIRGICQHYDLEAIRVAEAADAYAQAQQSNPRLVPGVEELFDALRDGQRSVSSPTAVRFSDTSWSYSTFFPLIPWRYRKR